MPTTTATSSSHHKEIKIVILGTGGVGKSAISMQYVQSIFIERYDPTIEDSYRKAIEVPSTWLGSTSPSATSTSLILEIMDTAGTDQFTAMRDLYMRNGDAFLLVYSIDSQSSLEYLASLYEQLLRVRGASPGSVPVLLVGNKCDLENERQISKQQVKQIAERWKLPPPIETSARKNMNINEAFMQLVQITLSQKNGQPLESKKRDKKNKCVII